jgi:hypothetical protein
MLPVMEDEISMFMWICIPVLLCDLPYILSVPVIMVQQAVFLIGIEEGTDDNSYPKVSYSDSGFLWLSTVPPGTCQDSAFNMKMTTSFHIAPVCLLAELLSPGATQSKLLIALFSNTQNPSSQPAS